MSSIFFKPWIGRDYEQGINGKKVLVLGESHYCGEGCSDCGDSWLHDDCMDFTNKVVCDYLNNDSEHEDWMNTYRKFERSLVNHYTTPAESREIWNSFMFYDYLQVAMDNPREAGTRAHYKAAAKPFFCRVRAIQAGCDNRLGKQAVEFASGGELD